MKTSNNLKTKTTSDTYIRVQLVGKKVQVHSSLEPPLEYSGNYEGSLQIKVHYDLFKHLGSYSNIVQFQMSYTRENRSESSRL